MKKLCVFIRKNIAFVLIFAMSVGLCACVHKSDSGEKNPTENLITQKHINEMCFETDATASEYEENPTENADTKKYIDETFAGLTEAATDKKVDENTQFVTPGVFNKWSSVDSNDPQIRKITNDTPGHQGVNLREEPDSSSQLIMVIPENTEVYWLNDTESSNTYVQVAVKADGKTYIGYVMERYVTTFTGIAFDYIVSYDTPGDAGVVLREKNSAESKAVLTVPEGTQVRVWEQEVASKEYWRVDVFHNGEVIGGYILAEYLESAE